MHVIHDDEHRALATIADRLTALPIEQQRELARLAQHNASEAGIFPLSYAQQMLWILNQWEAGSPLYNNTTIIYLSGRLRVSALELSLNEMIHRHEVLRTIFVALDGYPVQVVVQPAWQRLPLILPEGGISSTNSWRGAVERFARADACRAFHLSKEIPLRTVLLSCSETEYALVLTMHHIVSDNWSMGVFVQELTLLYNAFAHGQPSPLAALPIQYADFAVWQQSREQGQFLASQLAYWQQQLHALPQQLQLPTDRPRPQVQSFRGATCWFTLPQDLTQDLAALSYREGVTLFMTLLAAWNTLLFRYSQQEDIVVGSPIACRNHVELEDLIGFFVNMLVLRTRLAGDQSFRALLKTIREVTLEAYAHQEVPFARVVEALQPERQLSHNPLFQVVFILQNASEQALELVDIDVQVVDVDNGMSRFDLTMSLEETAKGLRGCIEYSTDLFDGDTISRMCGHFQTVLEGIITNPEQQLNELPLWSGTVTLTQEEIASLFEE